MRKILNALSFWEEQKLADGGYLRLVILSVLPFVGKVKSWSDFLHHHSFIEFPPCCLILDIRIVPQLTRVRVISVCLSVNMHV